MPGVSWQIQFSGEFDKSIDARIYDLDLFDTKAETVAELHKQGKKVICYVSAGSYEDWRPDSKDFPSEVPGKDYSGWPGEKWLDIRQIDKIGPIMKARLDLCKNKRFDGVDPDNINTYQNDTGFPLTAEDQIKYNMWLADEAHKRELLIGLKNDSKQVRDLLPYFDWALAESCFGEGWCDDLLGFIKAGKPVFQIEYTEAKIDFNAACKNAGEKGFSLIMKNRGLDSWQKTCQ